MQNNPKLKNPKINEFGIWSGNKSNIKKYIEEFEFRRMSKILILLLFLLSFSGDIFAQMYDFTLVQRRRYDQIHVEIWARSLQLNSPKLGNASLVINYNLDFLSPAIIQSPSVTDSVNHNINKANPIDVITSGFHSSNGYNSLSTRTYSPGGYFSLEINHNELYQSGMQPSSDGKGSFIGKLVFDIIGNPSDTSITGIQWSRTTPGVVCVFDINGNSIIDSVNLVDPNDFTILGITILSPNFYGQVVDRDQDYLATTGVYAQLGYPIYFERSVNTTNIYTPPVDNSLGYVFEYSLDNGDNWIEFGRVGETDQTGSVLLNNTALRSGEISNPGISSSFIITTQNQEKLSASNYREPIRVIWAKNKFFSQRSEQARIKITQLENGSYTPTTNINSRYKGNKYDINDERLVLGRLFFLQLNGENDYLKTKNNFSNATQLTVEAWVNLNSYQAIGSEPAIVASSGGPSATPINNSREGAFMLYLKDGRYPAFRVRELENRGKDGYLAHIIDYDSLNISSDVEPLADLHSKNWTHIAATVKNNEVCLYVNGELVDKFVNDSAIDIRMLTTVHPVWIGINPNDSISDSDYLHAGLKKVCIWRNALTQDEIRVRVAGVVNPSTISDYEDLKKGLQYYYSFEGNNEDAASDIYYQNGAEVLNYFIADSINNMAIKYRPDIPHVKLTAPLANVGVLNKQGDSFEIRWVSYGFGDIATSNSKDFEIEYSTDSGVNWYFANNSLGQPFGNNTAPDAEISKISWEPYQNTSGANLRTVTPYFKNTIMRIRGTSLYSQSDINDVTGLFKVAPYFSVKPEIGSIIVIPQNKGMNITGNTAMFEAWIKPYRRPTIEEGFFPIIEKLDSATNAHQYSLRLLSTGQIQLLLPDNSGRTRVALSDSALPVIEPNSFAIDTPWTHIAVYLFLNDGTGNSEIRFYIDGRVQRGAKIGGQLDSNIVLNTMINYPIYISYLPQVTIDSVTTKSCNFVGEIREVRFWNGVPNNKSVNGSEPTELTKFVQGALTAYSSEFIPSYAVNLHSTLSFNGTSFSVGGYNRAAGSTKNTKIIARLYGTPISYQPVLPYIKLVEPIYKQNIPNSKTDLRIRWVGFNYDGIAFSSGTKNPLQAPCVEFSIRGGGGNIIQPYQCVGSDYWFNNKVDAISFVDNDYYRFKGTGSSIVYALNLDVSIADPDKENDNTFIQGPLSAALTNARFRLTSLNSINGDPAIVVYSEGPLFTITPPSNFTIRVLLEGYHNGTLKNATMSPLASRYDEGGLKIKLFTDNAGTLGKLVDSAESVYGYAETNFVNRNSGNNKFANINFVFTELSDAYYWVVVEHINHLPIMSRFPAPFFYEGDVTNTWIIESGWDFESWNGVDNNLLPDNTINPWTSNYFTAYGDAISTATDPRYTITGLINNNGRAGGVSNALPAMVGGDVDRSGQINAADRVQVRLDDGTGLTRSDVTGDGYVNATDRTICDRNFGRVSSIFNLVIPSVINSDEPDKDILANNDNPFEYIDERNPELSKLFNDNVKLALSNIKIVSKNDKTQAGINYIVTAEPVLNNGVVSLSMYIQNVGDEFGLANCTFSVSYNSNVLKFVDLYLQEDVIFSDSAEVGYAKLRTAPTEDAIDPLPDVRTIEVDYDAYANLGGVAVPYTKTYLGTLRFNVKDKNQSIVFRWHPSCAVHTTKNEIVTEYGDFKDIKVLSLNNAKVTYPNGGESFSPGKTYQIKWTANGGDKIYIEFSSNNGTDWSKVTSDQIDIKEGYYDWTVPTIYSNNCLIRIVDVESASELDRSDSTFAISSNFATIIRPSSGDAIYNGGKTDNIRWYNSGYTSVRFEFSSDGGNSWVKIGGVIQASELVMPWKVPDVTTKQAYVRMIDAETETVIALSGLFKILSGTFYFTSPKTGDAFNVGNVTRIRWSATGVSLFDLYLSIDGGNSWELVQMDVQAVYSYMNWTIPDRQSDYAILKAIWMNDPEMEYGRTGIFKIKKINSVEENNELFIDEPYPNPFSDKVSISFYLPESQHISISISNAIGEEIFCNNGFYEVGENEFNFRGEELSSGIYFIKFVVGELVIMRKIVKVN